MKIHTKLIFFTILFISIAFRLYGTSWDSGFHMHPDERAIIIFTNDLIFPESVTEFLSPNSPWNPNFFAYGSFPLYLLYWITKTLSLFDPSFFSYDNLTIVGRFLSAFADIGTILMIFFIGKKLWGEIHGIISSALYGISVLAIQLSHFYAVDTLLTFFITTSLYLCIKFYEKPTFKLSLLIGTLLGLSFATKISATVLFVSFFASILLDFILIFLKQPHRFHTWKPHLTPSLKKLFKYGLLTTFATIIVFLIIEPYALIDHTEFIKQNLAQQAMTKSAFTFPYTLQYVFKTPYLYDLKQIFFLGLGPVAAIVCFLGVILRVKNFIFNKPTLADRRELILIIFLLTYFLIVGSFAIGFMRYMLPIYPILCLYGGYLLVMIYNKVLYKKIFVALSVVLLLIWPLSFVSIYSRPFTRLSASEWIVKNIPERSTLAIEHWDDSLPLFNQSDYYYETLPLYDYESSIKWSSINSSLGKSDYIILASNRLSTPLQKLTDCDSLPENRCYRESAEYYRKLFNGELGFKEVATFSSFPQIPFTSIKINDQGFDESFSVYDHPEVRIFKKTTD